LASSKTALSPREVQDRLAGEHAYTTVMTVLSRLHAKGIVSRQRTGRGYSYELPIPLDQVPASVQAHRMRQILDSGGDRSGVLARFVTDLTPEDEQVLLRLLSDADHDDEA
jgi:predicted transcriptional regulator